ncbi:MAG: alkyl sulfatase dimerization domain-containing protein, partial [Actinomycetota bacterium]
MTDTSASGPEQPKPASRFTADANAGAAISFDDPGDFRRAGQGLIAQLVDGRVMLGEDHVVFDVANHGFVSEQEEPPDTVHPGLWRQARLNVQHGLFEVAEGVWQVRGYDLANITFLAGDDGWLIIDPLTNAPAAAAALRLANETLGERPVTAVIYTHSHVDHFGGILGVTSQEAVDRGDVRIIAPEGFLHEVVSEFVIAGPIMGRRAAYQFGPLLPPGPQGHVDCGLGSAMGLARSDLVAPTELITETGQELVVNGIPIVFQNTPDAEAPAEMNFYFPDKRLLCMAENCTHTLHNLYPIRGAQTRDALAWSKYIQEAMTLWADRTDTSFASHHWPRFGNDDVRRFLTMQRDVYRWMHDQTMRLANDGHVPTEIAATLELPAEFDQSHIRGYYGTVSHNVRSVYNRYLGWYDGNPANLNPLPPVESGERYVEFMGGATEVLRRAREYFDRGEYAWVAQVVNHVVFADPSNREARSLQADALEQMGYQAESATWRNAYLMGAKELREGSPDWGRIP